MANNCYIVSNTESQPNQLFGTRSTKPDSEPLTTKLNEQFNTISDDDTTAENVSSPIDLREGKLAI